jgi:hypothetical protein
MKGFGFGNRFSLFSAGPYSSKLRYFCWSICSGYVRNQRAAFERLRLADFHIFHFQQASMFGAWQPSQKAGLKVV